jgi:hypothetical protein
MKKVLAAAGIGAALTVGVLTGAGAASASAGSYEDAMHNAGFGHHNGDSSMIAAGHEVCGYLYQGYSEYQVQRYIYRSTDYSIDWAEAGQIVAIAEDNLC